ncbi:transglycosylase SLT domain-containing protein [Sphingosinicella sp.]|uniref:transglycosylase SLT domain-containing protein n=1 Tax=Sphingosinicella sp. TaxID=1917971 RepID=UPI00403833F6
MIPTNNAVELRGAQGRVGAAIQQASARTGVDFTYLLNQARIESSLNPNARARTSSATGLYQFIEQTWLATVDRHGAQHGLGWAANAIQRGQNGRYHVADPQMRRAILDLRRNPEASAAMAAEFASDNGQYLERRLGRPAESVDLYLAHFLGAGGAARFLRAHDANPGAAAAGVLPAAARANRWVFYNRDGSPRSFAEIRERFAARIGGAGGDNPVAPRRQALPDVQLAALDPSFTLGVGKAGPVAAVNAEYARIAYLMLAGMGGAE